MTLYICPICRQRIRAHTKNQFEKCVEEAISFVGHLQYLRIRYPDEPLWENTEE